jgi:LAO/AO transport system kinase
VRALVPEVEQQVRNGELTATLAAERILTAFRPDLDVVPD